MGSPPPSLLAAGQRGDKAGLDTIEDNTKADETTNKKKVVFMGTPDVAALVLNRLLHAASLPDASFEIPAVVSQPGRPRGRHRIAQPSPVETAATSAGVPPERMLLPVKASERAFLDRMREIGPDLCVTAAYGNYLPMSFLSIPRFGTLNIHPSLLPAYRGAAPVQRALQDGVAFTGVSVLYTVKEMDAGPVLAQRRVPVPDDVQAPEFLEQLFDIGTDLLLEQLENVWSSRAAEMAVPQDPSKATHAPKISKEEALLNFNESAVVCHNKVRGFAGWPGTSATFNIVEENARKKTLELKIRRTRVPTDHEGRSNDENGPGTVDVMDTGSMCIRCGENSVLEVLELQAPGKKAVSARDFINGLKGRRIEWAGLQNM